MTERVIKKARQLLDALKVPWDMIQELDDIIEEEGPKREAEEHKLGDEGCDCVSKAMIDLSTTVTSLHTTMRLYASELREDVTLIDTHDQTNEVAEGVASSLSDILRRVSGSDEDEKKEEPVH